jgi:hypothetical protein
MPPRLQRITCATAPCPDLGSSLLTDTCCTLQHPLCPFKHGRHRSSKSMVPSTTSTTGWDRSTPTCPARTAPRHRMEQQDSISTKHDLTRTPKRPDPIRPSNDMLQQRHASETLSVDSTLPARSCSHPISANPKGKDSIIPRRQTKNSSSQAILRHIVPEDGACHVCALCLLACT